MKFFKKLLFIIPVLAMFCLSNAYATKELKLFFVGDRAAGKTALIKTLTDKSFDFLSFDCERHHHCHSNVKEATVNHYHCPLKYNGEVIMCNLIDTSGYNGRHGFIITDGLDTTHIAVIAIDVSDNTSRKYMDVIAQSLDEFVRIIRREQPNAYIILAATKSEELSQERKEKIAKKFERLKCWYNKRFDYVFTSARTGEGIGNLDSEGDFSNNFWDKIIEIIDNENMYPMLPEWESINREPCGCPYCSRGTFLKSCVIV